MKTIMKKEYQDSVTEIVPLGERNGINFESYDGNTC